MFAIIIFITKRKVLLDAPTACGIFYVRPYSVFLLEVLLSDGELYVTPVELSHDHVTGFGQ